MLNQTFAEKNFSSFIWIINAEYILSKTILEVRSQKNVNYIQKKFLPQDSFKSSRNLSLKKEKKEKR